MSVVRFLARPLLASSFIADGIHKIKKAQDPTVRPAALARRVADTLPVELGDAFLNRAAGGAQLGAGALFALGKLPRLAALVLAASAACTTALEYRAADATTKEGRAARRSQLLKNLSLNGAALLAVVDTAGKPSLVWRVQHRPEGGAGAAKGD